MGVSEGGEKKLFTKELIPIKTKWQRQRGEKELHLMYEIQICREFEILVLQTQLRKCCPRWWYVSWAAQSHETNRGYVNSAVQLQIMGPGALVCIDS